MTRESRLLDVAIELAREAGRALIDSFGGAQLIDKKGDNSNVVTAADLASERIIVQGIRQRYPGHSIIAEETGCDPASEHRGVACGGIQGVRGARRGTSVASRSRCYR